MIHNIGITTIEPLKVIWSDDDHVTNESATGSVELNLAPIGKTTSITPPYNFYLYKLTINNGNNNDNDNDNNTDKDNNNDNDKNTNKNNDNNNNKGNNNNDNTMSQLGCL